MPTDAYQLDPDIDFPSECLIHRIDIQADTETAGLGRKPVWQDRDKDIPALVVPLAEVEPDDFQRMGIDVTHLIYVGVGPDGKLPVVGTKNRIVFGKRPDGQPRTFAVVKAANIGELGVGLAIQAKEVTLT